MEKTNILGINISRLSRHQIRERLDYFLGGQQAHLITTPNAEIILEAQHDEELFYIINKADLAVLDGSGPQIAALIQGQPTERYPGSDLLLDLLDKAAKLDLPVMIINRKNGLSSNQEIEKALREKLGLKKLMLCAIAKDGSGFDFTEALKFGPAIIIANLGAPYQEKFLYRHLGSFPGLKIAIGIGGALDFVTGKAKRAPLYLRQTGLEWLWRLIIQPWRIKRIFNATIVFSYKFIKWRYFLSLFYRDNTACLLYEKRPDGYYIMMVERADQAGHWQIPQGGTDGQSPEKAGIRELGEELGIDEKELEIKAIHRHIWRYRFKEQRRAHVQKHLGYKGQKQSLLIAEMKNRKNDFKINFWDHTAWRWVKLEDFVRIADQRRQESYRLYEKLFRQLIKNHEAKI